MRRASADPFRAAGRGRPAVGVVLLAVAALTLEPGFPSPGAYDASAAAQELPEGMTPELVDQGRTLFHGSAACITCHGDDGRGVPNLGPDLTDREWVRGDGSFSSLVERIRCGVPAEISSGGVPMPPRGGVRLTDEETRALAAYVWTLSHRDGG